MRAAIEITAVNIVPGQPDIVVRLVWIIDAERQESEVRAYVVGARAGEGMLTPGLVKLSRENAFDGLKTLCEIPQELNVAGRHLSIVSMSA